MRCFSFSPSLSLASFLVVFISFVLFFLVSLHRRLFLYLFWSLTLDSLWQKKRIVFIVPPLSPFALVKPQHFFSRGGNFSFVVRGLKVGWLKITDDILCVCVCGLSFALARVDHVCVCSMKPAKSATNNNKDIRTKRWIAPRKKKQDNKTARKRATFGAHMDTMTF